MQNENVECFQDQRQFVSAAFGAGKQMIENQHTHALKATYCTLFLVILTTARFPSGIDAAKQVIMCVFGWKCMQDEHIT